MKQSVVLRDTEIVIALNMESMCLSHPFDTGTGLRIYSTTDVQEAVKYFQ